MRNRLLIAGLLSCSLLGGQAQAATTINFGTLTLDASGNVSLPVLPGYAFSLAQQLNPAATTPFTLTREDAATLTTGFANHRANVAANDAFCSGHDCRISAIPDQNGSSCTMVQANFANMIPYRLKDSNGLPFAWAVGQNSLTTGQYLMSTIGSCPAVKGTGPKSLITKFSTRLPSAVGGEAGIREDGGLGAEVSGTMFSQMVCNTTTWCPSKSVGLDEETGGFWPGLYWSGPAIADAPADGVAIEAYNGTLGNSWWNGTPEVVNGTPTEPLNANSTMVWGADGDLTAVGPLSDIQDQLVVSTDVSANALAYSADLQGFYSAIEGTPGINFISLTRTNVPAGANGTTTVGALSAAVTPATGLFTGTFAPVSSGVSNNGVACSGNFTVNGNLFQTTSPAGTYHPCAQATMGSLTYVQDFTVTITPTTPNSITLTNASGATITNYPYQFGRPFVDGAITNEPQVLINGTPVATQADVKNRYADGSVKFAVIAAVIPTLPTTGPTVLTFQNQTAGNNTPLTRAQMVAALTTNPTMTLASPATIVSGVVSSAPSGSFGMYVNGTLYQMNVTAGATAAAVQAAFTAAGAPVHVTAINDSITSDPRIMIRTLATGPSASLQPAQSPACGTSCTDISAALGLTAATIGTGDPNWFPANVPSGTTYHPELMGTTASVNLSTMVNAGFNKLWTSGPIAQTVIVGDDSATRTYDIGFGDGYHPFRPKFYVTFWNTGQVMVRAVGENPQTMEAEDAAYALTISGVPTPYTKDLTGNVYATHWWGTRWSRTFWLGGAPTPQVNIDNNLAYLESTRYLPNFDPNLQLSQASITTEYANYTQNANDIYDGSADQPSNSTTWQTYMPSTGGRQDIAPYPQWTAMWLYGGDWRMRQVALGLADQAASWPMHLRETNASAGFLLGSAAGSGTGKEVGRVFHESLNGNPFEAIGGNTQYYTLVGPADVGSWSWDGAHQPAPFFPQYVLTGDPFYLDEMTFWASVDAFDCIGVSNTYVEACGPATGAGTTVYGGAKNDQLRGVAWTSRNTAEAAIAEPDGTPEQTYFVALTKEFIASEEGAHHITGTAFDGTPEKVWAQNVGSSHTANAGALSGQAPPLHNWESICDPTVPFASCIADPSWLLPTVAGSFTEPWFQWYLQYSLGRIAELGFPIQALNTYTAVFPLGMVNSSGNPWLVAYYDMSSISRITGAFFPDWSSWQSALNLTGCCSATGGFSTYFINSTGSDGRAFWLTPGMAMMVDENQAGAGQAYRWWTNNVLPLATDLPNDPKWDIVPRTDANILPAQ